MNIFEQLLLLKETRNQEKVWKEFMEKSIILEIQINAIEHCSKTGYYPTDLFISPDRYGKLKTEIELVLSMLPFVERDIFISVEGTKEILLGMCVHVIPESEMETAALQLIKESKDKEGEKYTTYVRKDETLH